MTCPSADALERYVLDGEPDDALARHVEDCARCGPLVDTLRTLPQPFTVSEARRALGTTRRVAVPLLEQLDARRVTRRGVDRSEEHTSELQSPA